MQSTFSKSSIEIEYKSLTHCAVDMFWISSLLKDVNQYPYAPPCLHWLIFLLLHCTKLCFYLPLLD